MRYSTTKKHSFMVWIIAIIVIAFIYFVTCGVVGNCMFGLHIDDGPATCEKDKRCVICGTILEKHHGHEYDLRFAKDHKFHECDDSLWCVKCNKKSIPTAEHQWVTSIEGFSEECVICGKINILGGNTTAKNNSTYVSREEKIEAMTMAQELVKLELKSPSTASFPWSIDEYTITKKGDQYTVKGYVDAMNGFGVKVRTKFETCFTYKLEGANYRATKVYTIID